MTDRPIRDPRVRDVFDAYPPEVRRRLLELRELIFDTTEDLDGVGPIEETLRWGEPAYLTTVSGTGSTIRIDSKDPASGQYALYVHCQTSLIETFKARHGGNLAFEGKRAVLLSVQETPPVEALRDCIALALTYRIRTVAGRRRRASAALAPTSPDTTFEAGYAATVGRSRG